MSSFSSNNNENKLSEQEQNELDELENLFNSSDSLNNVNSKNNTKQIFKKTNQIKTSNNLLNFVDELDKPKNYGNKWSEEDKTELIKLLNENKNKEIDYVFIANKLGRSEGGVKGEVKKMILSRYLNGEDAEKISIDMNVQYKFVKILIKTYLENEVDSDINNLEKENKLLKLKIENIALRKNIFELSKK